MQDSKAPLKTKKCAPLGFTFCLQGACCGQKTRPPSPKG
jgi:hypothetical protein